MTKYKQAVADMLAAHKNEFDEFKKYGVEDPEFNELGKPLLRIISETENRLCGKMEGAGKGSYSANLAEKFRQELRIHIPLVDMIGVVFK